MMKTKQVQNDSIRNEVRDSYAKVALASNDGCCSSTISCNSPDTDISRSLELGYSDSDLSAVPEGANMGLGCGNPRAIAALQTGETVLDLGSGGGFDCFLASREVGDSGHVIGVDMTAEMITKARLNAEKAGSSTIEFRLGEIEHLPVADSTIDVIISNCVINLSPNKAQVMREAYRVLKPGGRIAISDVVATADLPEEILSNKAMFAGCMAGATYITELEEMLEQAGFVDITIEPKDESKSFIRKWAVDSNIEDYVVSANIEAAKPL